jgi:TPR repeat protein
VTPLLWAGLLACGQGAQQAPELARPVVFPDAPPEQAAEVERHWTHCVAGTAAACSNLGAVYYLGELVAQDAGRAAALYQRACEGGKGCVNLGFFYERGLGVDQDFARAAALYRGACAGGDLAGCKNLGVLLTEGRGVPADLPGARALYRQVCDAGDAEGCNALGHMLLQGKGGPADEQGALALFERACEGGAEPGCANLSLIRGRTEEGAFLSPSPGAEVAVGTLMVGAVLPRGFDGDAAARLTLDGAPADDPLQRVRTGRTSRGDGALFLATLSLFDLEPGPHRLALEVSAPGGAQATLESGFTWAPPAARVVIEVRDAAGAPTDARVQIRQRGGPAALAGPDAAALDPMNRDARLSSVFTEGGRAEVFLEPGWARFVAVRGVRDGLGVAEETLAPGTQTLTLVVPRAVETPGQVTADLHVHTGNSGDAYTPDRLRAASLRAADVELAALTDHYRVTDPAAMGVSGVAGIEVQLGARGGESAGHLNAFPLTPREPPPWGWSDGVPQAIDAVWADWREAPALAAAPVVQLNHPRGLQLVPEEPPRAGAHALFNARGYDRALPPGEGSNAWMTRAVGERGTAAVDFELLEVVNRFSWPLYREVRADWFALIEAGYPRTATGNSDSHGLALELAGLPVNLVRAPAGDLEGFVAALRAGRVSVSTGPIVELEVTGASGAGQPGDIVSAPDGRVSARVRVRAAPWVPVHEVRLVVNGEVSAARTLEEPLPEGGALVTLERELALDADAWIVAEAGWPIGDDRPVNPVVEGLYGEVAPGYVPLGFTNPVWIDVDGDGAWR